MSQLDSQFVFSNPWHFIACGFGAGLSPKAPGTMGTLVGIPLFLLLSNVPILTYCTLLLILIIGGIYCCQVTSDDLGVHDHPGIVWDEVVGYLITMLGFSTSFVHIVLGFALFRFFDIVKPWPIGFIDEKIEGGLGIMFDDILAGIMAWLVMQIIFGIFN